MKKEVIILILLLAVAVCKGQTNDSLVRVLPTTRNAFKSEQPKPDTTKCYIVYIDTYMSQGNPPNGFGLWMYGYKIEKAVFHPHDSFLYPPPISDWYMEFDKYLDSDKKPLKPSIIVLMSKQISK